MTEAEYYLDKARRGEGDDSYHGLIELPDSALPELREAYSAEPDPAVRSLIVHAVWQHRRPSNIQFLGVALEDPHPEVWKEALDGLVALASPEAREVLVAAMGGGARNDTERLAWISEAIAEVAKFRCGETGMNHL